MNAVLDFLAGNWIWFLVAALIVAFALVGYIIQNKNSKEKHDEGFESDTLPTQPIESEIEMLEPVKETTEVIETLEPLEVFDEEPSVAPVYDFNQPIITEEIEPEEKIEEIVEINASTEDILNTTEASTSFDSFNNEAVINIDERQ